jgi:hypothetical protein
MSPSTGFLSARGSAPRERVEVLDKAKALRLLPDGTHVTADGLVVKSSTGNRRKLLIFPRRAVLNVAMLLRAHLLDAPTATVRRRPVGDG